jgi:hypothetical protein
MSFTKDARRRLLIALQYRTPCPTCGHVKFPGLKAAASWVGIAPSSLGRFLRGEAVSSDNLDRIVAYIQKKGVVA